VPGEFEYCFLSSGTKISFGEIELIHKPEVNFLQLIKSELNRKEIGSWKANEER